MRSLIAVAMALAMAGVAEASSREVQYGPAPAWVVSAPKPTEGAAPAGAPTRVVFVDQQVRVNRDGQETYTAVRIKVQAPEGLAIGDPFAAWNPESDEVTVHALRILRRDQTIDVLKSVKFHVVERDDEADLQALNGLMTARLHVPGLQVGDELEFVTTLRRQDKVFQNRAGAALQFPANAAVGAFRFRLIWPETVKLRWQATPDLGEVKPALKGGQHELVLELRDPPSALPVEGAPARFNARRRIAFSGFSDWGELSNTYAPLIEAAATLKSDSAVAQEADRIAKASEDPQVRAEAALALVQDQIRYVYIGLNGGGYRPASADETWERRFGDCKAKTVLLLALLRRLGVESEAVLVNSTGADGTDQHLPTPGDFDHMLVRARIKGKVYWLDGTRTGEHRLAALTPPIFQWALPVRTGPAGLEAVPAEAPLRPLESDVVEIDARAGFREPAKVRVEQVLRGDAALVMKGSLASLAAADAERLLKAYFRQQRPWATPTSAAWRFDETQNTLILTMSGEGKPDWQGDDQAGRRLFLESAGFTPPAPYQRPKDQDQTAPWSVSFPTYDRWTTIVRLPPARAGWRWTYQEAPVHRQFAGRSYWREVEMKDGVLRSTMSSRSLKREISAAEARDVDARLPQFDNAMSSVFEAKLEKGQTANDQPGEPVDRVLSLEAQRALARAHDAAAAGRLVEALAAVDAARVAEPESAAVLKARAGLLHRLGRHEEALADLDEALRINPFDAASLADRAQEVKDQSRPEAAPADAKGKST
jgi:tetratricopeptide (TPR) repeat protein